MKERGRALGAPFENWKWWPATMQCHRLIAFAEERGVSTVDSNTALFKALYEEGKNVSSHQVLGDIAQSFGLDKEQAMAFLASSEGERQVVQQIDQGRAMGIQGVPFFVVSSADGGSGQPEVIRGAGSSRSFTAAFNKLSSGV
mmetsp:Transcript_50109/g.144101  ORF Transcript_50109/g.144101 Transcript_50109/m.144101 type:complete len:143 (-) Transcript_50109:115-543(-)